MGRATVRSPPAIVSLSDCCFGGGNWITRQNTTGASTNAPIAATIVLIAKAVGQRGNRERHSERADAEENAEQTELRAALAFADIGRQRVGRTVEDSAAEADREHKELNQALASGKRHAFQRRAHDQRCSPPASSGSRTDRRQDRRSASRQEFRAAAAR